MSKAGGRGAPKPLKGTSLSSNNGVFNTLSANNLILSSVTVEGLISGAQFQQVTILDSEITNTIIGVNGPNQAYFTTLNTNNDVVFTSQSGLQNVSWDSTNGIFNVTGTLNIHGCATIGNLNICQNTISAINNNGDINIVPNKLGTIYLTGPINNTVSSIGNYLTSLANGNITLSSSDYINLTSNQNSINLNSFDNQSFSTLNGDISLNTEKGIGTKFITSIIATGGNIQITTAQISNLKVGDIVTLSETNSIPNLNGVFTIKNITSSNSFNISVGNTFSGITTTGTTGNLIKTKTNNINLNASVYVKIPTDIKLTFGTTSNSVSGNTSGLIFNSIGDISLLANTSGSVNIPQNTKFVLGTSANNYLNFDGTSTNLYSNNTITISASTGIFNVTDAYFLDPNPVISNYISNSLDQTDRGIQFRYYSNIRNTMEYGWFGYKASTNKFTFLQNTTNTNEIITGTLSKFDIGDVSSTSITLTSGGNLNLACGNLLNVNTITGCNGTVNINGSNVNINTNNRISLISSKDILVPNNIPLLFGTSGSNIKENTKGNIVLSSFNNINLISANSVSIPVGIKLSFDGSSVGSTSIISDTSGNLLVNVSTGNLLLNLSTGNIIIPQNTNIQFGNSSNNVSGNTSGIKLNANNGSLSLFSNSDVNISSSSGNILLNPKNDVNLFTSSGNIRILQNSSLVFNISGTSNSILNSNNNLLINGGSANIDINNLTNLNLNPTNSINVPTNVKLNIGTEKSRYITSDTNNNLFILNNNTTGSIFLNSNNIILNSTSGNISINNINTNLSNQSTNVSSNNFNITGTTGSITNINTDNVKLSDPILTLANYPTNVSDIKDRGIEFTYYTNGSTHLGWFGFKNSGPLNGQFTFFNDAINNNEIITGTQGNLSLNNVLVSNNLSAGQIDLNCGTISNVNTITGCRGVVNINASSNVNVSSNNLLLNTKNISLPFNTPINFGNSSNSISADTSGNIFINSLNGSGNLILNSNVQINGTTNNVYSTITNYQDPILSIGGLSGPIVNDNKDRGIEFKWNDGTEPLTGFFGYKNSLNRFVFIQKSTNNNEIISGNFGNVQFNNAYLNNLDINCGTISNISTITGCTSLGLNIVSPITLISSGNLILSNNSKLNFNDTSNSLSADTLGNISLYSSNGNISLLTNTTGNSFVKLSNNTPLLFGTTSNSISSDSSGNLSLNNSGNILLNTLNNTSNGSSDVILNSSSSLVFGGNNTRINGDNTDLNLYGYNIGINSSTVTISGNVNIVGTLSALHTSVTSDVYIFPVGTSLNDNITSITNTNPTSSNVIITTINPAYLTIGDRVTLKNTNSDPIIDGDYIVKTVINNSTFTITHTPLVSPGDFGTLNTNLTSDPGKDIGLQFDYYSNFNGITSGSVNYKTGFLGYSHNLQRLVYYKEAIITNDTVTSKTLGNFEVNQLITSSISGFTLLGSLIGSNNVIAGSNFQISGGQIDNTPIGQTTAQTGRFTNLSSTISSNLSNVTLSNNLNYSIDRYTLSSLVPTRNPSLSSVISFVSVSGNSFIGSGTMGTSSITDGQLKKIVVSSMGSNCEYHLVFPTGKLIAPNPGGGLASTIVLKRRGQSFEMAWDGSLNAWIMLTSGAYVI